MLKEQSRGKQIQSVSIHRERDTLPDAKLVGL